MLRVSGTDIPFLSHKQKILGSTPRHASNFVVSIVTLRTAEESQDTIGHRTVEAAGRAISRLELQRRVYPKGWGETSNLYGVQARIGREAVLADIISGFRA